MKKNKSNNASIENYKQLLLEASDVYLAKFQSLSQRKQSNCCLSEGNSKY